jgi:hypothetical protein
LSLKPSIRIAFMKTNALDAMLRMLVNLCMAR